MPAAFGRSGGAGFVALAGAAACLALATASCGPAKPADAGPGAAPRLDAFCTVAGLPAALRQSVLVVDEQAVRPAADPAAIRTSNPELFQLVAALGSPQAIQSGTMAAREHLSVFVAPSDGTAPRLVFSGCAPGVSPEERRGLAAKTSGLKGASDSFFAQGPVQKAAEEADRFQTALLGALVQLVKAAPARSASAAMTERSLTRSLQAVPQLAPPEYGVNRLFLFTDLANFAPEGLSDTKDARTRGFADADRARLALDLAQVHVIGPSAARDPNARSYAEAFLLGSQGRLLSWGGATLSALPKPPVKVQSFQGEIAYPDNPSVLMRLRVGVDRTGQLVDSWVFTKTQRAAATPLTGSLACDSDDVCRVATDQGGFAQVWARDPGPEFKVEPDMPLGGLRQLSAEIRGGVATGRIFDPAVDRIGHDGPAALTFKLTLAPQG